MNTSNQTNPSATKKIVNIVIASKGGVGKTTYAVKLAEWYQNQGITPVCIDADARNMSAAIKAYPALNAISLDMIDGKSVSSTGFHKMLDTFDSEDGPFIVDVGSNTYQQFVSYSEDLSLPELIEEMGCRVQLHVILATGNNTPDSLESIEYLSQNVPWPFFVVLNEFNGGTVEVDGASFEYSAMFNQLLDAEKVNGLVRLPAVSHVQTKMLEQLSSFRLTAREITGNPKNSISIRGTIKGWANGFFKEFDKPANRESLIK
jgi:hypothetical protein